MREADRKRLDTWKQIADYLQCSERTAMRQAKGNNLPVHFWGGTARQRVFAYPDELDEWIHAPSNRQVALPRNQKPSVRAEDGCLVTPPILNESEHEIFSPTPRGKTRRRVWVLFTVSLLVVILGVLAFLQGNHRSPREALNQVRTSDHVLFGLDAEGNELWQHSFPGSVENSSGVFSFTANRNILQSAMVVDLDGDGRLEALAVAGPRCLGEVRPWELYCLNERGHTRWRYQPGERLAFGNGHCDENWTLCFEPVDLDHDGQRELVVLARNHRLYPAKVALLDCNGRIRGEYVNSGWVEDMNFTDIDGDGILEILVGAVNNGYERPVVFALKSKHIAGSSSQPDNPSYQCLGRPPGMEMYYLLLPRDPVSRQLQPFSQVQSITTMREQIIARSFSHLESPPLDGGIDFIFNLDMSLRSADANSYYKMIYGILHKEGLLKVPFSPQIIQSLEPILYWNGEHYTPEPARNQLYVRAIRQ